MEKFLEFFARNPWISVISFFLTVVSFILAFVFYYKSLKNRKPVFSKRSIRLIRKNVIGLQKLSIQYEGLVVENLTVTKFALWNSGRESIKMDDIAPNDPLLIKAVDSIIYDFELNSLNPANNFQVHKIDEKTLLISFDYFDFNQGVVLSIYHSGTTGKGLSISGSIIGATNISSGIRKHYLMGKFSFFDKPMNYLLNVKNPFIKLLGVPFIVVMICILIPIFIIVSPIDYLYEKSYKFPEEFNLIDNDY